jgi:hypothetical protein
VKITRHIFAALVLLAWLYAGAHVALEHGGETLTSHLSGAVPDDHHHDDHDHDEPAPRDAEHHHHHDLGELTGTQFTKSVEHQALIPQWVALYDRLIEELAEVQRRAAELDERSVVGESPPDERAVGWLLVVQTALPVRGPSLLS